MGKDGLEWVWMGLNRLDQNRLDQNRLGWVKTG